MRSRTWIHATLPVLRKGFQPKAEVEIEVAQISQLAQLGWRAGAANATADMVATRSPSQGSGAANNSGSKPTFPPANCDVEAANVAKSRLAVARCPAPQCASRSWPDEPPGSLASNRHCSLQGVRFPFSGSRLSPLRPGLNWLWLLWWSAISAESSHPNHQPSAEPNSCSYGFSCHAGGSLRVKPGYSVRVTRSCSASDKIGILLSGMHHVPGKGGGFVTFLRILERESCGSCRLQHGGPACLWASCCGHLGGVEAIIRSSSSTISKAEYAGSTGANNENADVAAHSSACVRTSLGRRAHELIIALNRHPAGRGPSGTTTSPSASSPATGAPSLLEAVVPPQSSTTLPSLGPSATHDAGLDVSDTLVGLAPVPVPTGLIANTTASSDSALSNVTTSLAADIVLPIGSSQNVTATDDTTLDAQAIQAQVAALIQSTSTSVAHKAAVDQLPALPGLPPAPILPGPGSSASSATTLDIARTAASDSDIGVAAIDQQLPSSQQADLITGDSSGPSVPNAASASRLSLPTTSTFANTLAPYQVPQNADGALDLNGRAASSQGTQVTGAHSPVTRVTDAAGRHSRNAPGSTQADTAHANTSLSIPIPDSQQPKAESFSGADLAAAAKAIGLEADAELLGGMDDDQRALAAAIKRLGDEHGEAAQKAIQQAAAAAAAAAAARASQELARAAAREPRSEARPSSSGAVEVARSSTPASVASPASKAGSGPAKRFPCPKCDKAFARAYNLNTHLSTHDPDPNRSKPFPCPYPSCKSEGGRSFSRKHDLQRHVASIHESEAEPGIHGDPEEVVGGDTGGLVSLGLGTPGKKFRCHSCGRSFVRRDARNRHQCDGQGSPSERMSESPSSTTLASSGSPRPSASYGMVGGSAVTLPPIRPMVSALHAAAAASPAYGRPSQSVAGRPGNSLSKEVQAVAKQLQARVEAQSPGPQGQGASQRSATPLSSGERRNFPLSAISLYASTGTSNMHPGSSSSSSNGKVQIAK